MEETNHGKNNLTETQLRAEKMLEKRARKNERHRNTIAKRVKKKIQEALF